MSLSSLPGASITFNGVVGGLKIFAIVLVLLIVVKDLLKGIK